MYYFLLKVLTLISVIDIIYSCNKYIVNWSGPEGSSHIDLCLCALFLWSDMSMKFNINNLEVLKECVISSFNNNEIPVGAIICNSNGYIVGKGNNTRQFDHNLLGHAEINAILDAEKNIGDWRLDGYYMIVSLEPCEMCKLLINESRLDKVYYFLHKPDSQNTDKYIEIFNNNEYKDEFNKLLTKFFNNKR